MLFAIGVKTKNKRSSVRNAQMILVNAPALRTASCSDVFFFFMTFSSGSTNAARSGPRKAKPEDLMGIL